MKGNTALHDCAESGSLEIMKLLIASGARIDVDAYGGSIYIKLHSSKSNPNFRDITRNVEENEILHEIFRVVSRFPRYISCYISNNRLPLGQGSMIWC